MLTLYFTYQIWFFQKRRNCNLGRIKIICHSCRRSEVWAPACLSCWQAYWICVSNPLILTIKGECLYVVRYPVQRPAAWSSYYGAITLSTVYRFGIASGCLILNAVSHRDAKPRISLSEKTDYIAQRSAIWLEPPSPVISRLLIETIAAKS